MSKNSKIIKSDAEWRSILTPEQYAIARHQGTEPAFTGPHLNEKRAGVYTCACCGTPLFGSETKFESGTGWPSFFAAVDEANIEEHRDTKFGMVRIETCCAKCDAHLGHVFEDGPAPSGLRYCMNGHALNFTEKKA
jgi:peptide-methionine (R)-S-oxide reductase